jgi:hypothetical protein
MPSSEDADGRREDMMDWRFWRRRPQAAKGPELVTHSGDAGRDASIDQIDENARPKARVDEVKDEREAKAVGHPYELGGEGG